ncbi:MAG: M20/M25/M40 family metallo-hydrolase [Gemmatimonadetes bacterium]|nr:M20/M25/M40 family metallo-hydrolase [Gemmatimonadota bacterium]
MRVRFYNIVVVVAVASVGCAGAGSRDLEPPGTQEAVATITASDAERHLAFLASDALRGRATPSPGLDTAVAYLSRELASFGLSPGVGDTSYVQRYPYPLVRLTPEQSRLEIRGPGGAVLGRPGVDFAVSPGRTPRIAGRVRGVAAPAAAADGGSDPPPAVAAALPGATGTPSWLQARDRNVREAALRNAAAVIHVVDAATSSDLIRDVTAAVSRPARLFGGLAPLAEVFVTGALLESALGRSIPAGELDSLLGTVPVEIELAVPAEHMDQAEGVNAVALYRGADPLLSNTYVVVTAHVDHLGVGEPVNGDSIYNGADDDASGVTALLEVAQAFTALPSPPRRSVIFIAVSGEEAGLLGSRWFLEHSPVPVDSIVADLNLDMVGRNGPDSLALIGGEFSSLGRVVRDVAGDVENLGLVVTGDRWPEEQFFFRSDHFNFVTRGIPAVFVFAGVHEDYHQPSDEPDRVDADKVARVARLAFHTVLRVANSPDRPEWSAQGREVLRSLGR